MDLEETETRNDCAGEGKQQLNRPIPSKFKCRENGIMTTLIKCTVYQIFLGRADQGA
jgi:hypothetical protein